MRQSSQSLVPLKRQSSQLFRLGYSVGWDPIRTWCPDSGSTILALMIEIGRARPVTRALLFRRKSFVDFFLLFSYFCPLTEGFYLSRLARDKALMSMEAGT